MERSQDVDKENKVLGDCFLVWLYKGHVYGILPANT